MQQEVKNTKEIYDEWFAGLKVGDKVLYPSSRYHHEAIVKITRVTPSGMLGLSNGQMTNKDGSIRGDKYFSIKPITEEAYKRIFRRKMLKKLHGTDFSQFSDVDLRKIYDLVNGGNSL